MYGTVWVFIGLLIALLILAIITRNKHLLRSAIIYVAVLMLFVVMFIGGIDLVRFLRDNVSLLFTGSSSGTGGGGSSASGNPVTSLVLMTAIIAGLAITVAVLLAVRKKLKPKHHRKADRRLQAADVISRTIKELQRGDDFRLAIIRCYRRFCRLLGEHGIRKQDILTPRELEALAFERFRLKKTSLDKLTLLFEEARYSPHEISGDNRAEAVMCLHAIKTELEKAEATAWQS
jgi:multisubunit Na+/H+ antiporter MnhC subunit